MITIIFNTSSVGSRNFEILSPRFHEKCCVFHCRSNLPILEQNLGYLRKLFISKRPRGRSTVESNSCQKWNATAPRKVRNFRCFFRKISTIFALFCIEYRPDISLFNLHHKSLNDERIQKPKMR